MTAPRALLFYAAWPLGYHNVEAERKAVRFALEGYDVVYVAGIGTRDPRLSSVPKLLDRVGRKLGRHHTPEVARVAGLRSASVMVLPPRRTPPIRWVNERWVERQLKRSVTDWSGAVAWVRWPSQEVVAALRRLRPAVVVYESVDANHLSPGITGRWSQVFEAAERDLVALADVVVVPGEVLAQRYRPWGTPVRILPHGVDVGAWREDRTPRGMLTLGFVGSLDYRLDVDVLRGIAQARPGWSIRLIGPVQEGFDTSSLSQLPNVSIEPPVPTSEVAALNSAFDVGLLAYGDHPHYRHMAPLKALELLAAGAPVVARWNPALAELGELVHFADSTASFVERVEEVSGADSPELARRRRTAAEQHRWDLRLDEMCAVVDGLAREKLK